MGYHFYNPHENNVSVARYAELFENSVNFTRSSGSLTLLKASGSFLEYTQLENPEFYDTLIQHMESVKKSIDERAQHKQEYDSMVNERQMPTIEEKVDTSNALDASLVDTKSSGTESREQDISSRSGNDAHADDADIRPIYDEEPMAERAKVTAIKESKDLTSLYLDKLIENLKVHEMIIKKDSKIVKAKVEKKSLALKAKKQSSDEECLTSGSKDEEFAIVVRDFKKFFKRRGRFVRQPRNDKKTFQRSRDDNTVKVIENALDAATRIVLLKNVQNHRKIRTKELLSEDLGAIAVKKMIEETCLVAHASNEVCSESSYFSNENSSIDDLALDNEYDKLCKMSLKIITKNKRLKATRNSLENKLRELKIKFSTLEKNKGVNLDCAKCHTLKIKNEKLKEKSTSLNKFEKSTH
uniref:UBN2 domain-containing protein n=1 Tax=Tanacetum cinerariifolium TaxID=118510 RepID=A0A6L2JKH0_TANCI|nr:UBN2 domain-containing protein [Tanacetum cinerariifolium]